MFRPASTRDLPAAVRHLGAVADRGDRGAGRRGDPGTPVLAALVLAAPQADAVDRATAERALAAWLATVGSPISYLGLYGDGLAGRYLSLRVAAAARPELAPVVTASRRLLARRSGAAGAWRATGIDWIDYDLITGPAGVLLALASGPAADPTADPTDLAPAAAHLARLCDRPGLPGLRVHRTDDNPPSGWSPGRINGGVGHGVPGVALGLCAALDTVTEPGLRADLRAALRRIADFLTAEAEPDSRQVITWSPVAREGDPGRPADADRAAPRQAWCYGTPGAAWALWETGRVLGDPAARELARTAFGSFLAAGALNVNPTVRDGLGLCHGDAGLLVLCDAFDRHAGLPGAAATRDLLADRLRAHLAALPAWSIVDDSLLTGPAGMLAALLTTAGGDRTWLRALGVR